MQNHYDAFSHSLQCDGFFSILSNIVGGVVHEKCRCWCHNDIRLFAIPEPEYDLSPPPEYANSADLAFMLDEQGYIRVGFSHRAATAEPLTLYRDNDATIQVPPEVVIVGERGYGSAIDIFTGPANKAGFTNWSQRELKSGKCETCGDALADCECVE